MLGHKAGSRQALSIAWGGNARQDRGRRINSMGVEIERKFLVKSEAWKDCAHGALPIRQGYIATGPPTAVRVRIEGQRANLNIKKAVIDIRRDEFEYPIPLADAEEMLASLCNGLIVEKVRHLVDYEGLTWEVDVFRGRNEGLVVAEVELECEDMDVALPSWAGKEVSGDPRYLNTHLALKPFSSWQGRSTWNI